MSQSGETARLLRRTPVTKRSGFKIPSSFSPRPDQFRWKKICAALFLCALAITAPAQTVKPLLIFDGPNGAFPEAPVIQGSDGSIYGTTEKGGTESSGTVFKFAPPGKLTVLYNFCTQSTYCADGQFPIAGVVQGKDGNFYGTASAGGGIYDDWGTIFKLSAAGSLTTLHSFSLTDGASPRGMVQGVDGNFYGISFQGGSNTGCFDGPERYCGTVFKITPAGEFTTLYNFCSQSNCSDGANPIGALVLSGDGNFYGVTSTGGSGATDCDGGCGTVFKITTAGVLTTLHVFCSQSGCPDGNYPGTGLVQATDGNFYGTTINGGILAGTVFKITPTGVLTTLYDFCGQTSCPDGAVPESTLVQGRDGNLYGTSTGGGIHGDGGTIFNITLDGVFTTLYSFCARGVWPYCAAETPVGGLVQSTSGAFYGTTLGPPSGRCVQKCGTLFSFGIDLALKPTSGSTGRQISITGLNLTGATKVKFNGVAAGFTVISATNILAKVPSGATTGPVRVITPGGVLKSNTTFLVTQP
jgi:uncharacterized repeat protein (TIGR03803 family)